MNDVRDILRKRNVGAHQCNGWGINCGPVTQLEQAMVS